MNSFTITLNNYSTAGETISNFWVGGKSTQNDMSVAPSGITTPSGWTYAITHNGSGDGYGIEYSTTTSPLASGTPLAGFAFQSAESLAQLQANSSFYPTTPSLTSLATTGSGQVSLLPLAQGSLVVFGDSLSDVGNSYNTGHTFLNHLIQPPYYTVGHYADGPDTTPSTTKTGIWVEQLATRINLPFPTASSAGGCDYAFGGAVTGTGGSGMPPGMSLMVSVFLKDFPNPSPAATYILWGGGNDLTNVTQASAMPAAEATAIGNLKTEIGQLATAGAKNFIWLDLPPLGGAPGESGSSLSPALNAAAAQFVTDWTAAIPQLQTTYPGIKITGADVYALYNEMTANPASYGFSNITTPAQGLSVNPDTYLNWDIEHPTTVGYGFIANMVYTDIAAINTDTPAMPDWMLVGLALLLTALAARVLRIYPPRAS